MVKILQVLSLKNFLSKFSSFRETCLRQTSFLDAKYKESLDHELMVANYIEKLKQLEEKGKNLEKLNEEQRFKTTVQSIEILDQQLQLINSIIKKQNNRNQIKYFSMRLNILEKAAQYFYSIWKLDNQNLDYLRKYLDVIKCYKGALSDQYLIGLCQLSLASYDYSELQEIYGQLSRNNNSETQKYCSMCLFILTQNEQYYEHSLLNDSEIQDKTFEIKFHLFASQYFEKQKCHHTTHFHKKQCEKMSYECQRTIAQSKLELQLSFMKTNHQM